MELATHIDPLLQDQSSITAAKNCLPRHSEELSEASDYTDVSGDLRISRVLYCREYFIAARLKVCFQIHQAVQYVTKPHYCPDEPRSSYVILRVGCSTLKNAFSTGAEVELPSMLANLSSEDKESCDSRLQAKCHSKKRSHSIQSSQVSPPDLCCSKRTS